MSHGPLPGIRLRGRRVTSVTSVTPVTPDNGGLITRAQESALHTPTNEFYLRRMREATALWHSSGRFKLKLWDKRVFHVPVCFIEAINVCFVMMRNAMLLSERVIVMTAALLSISDISGQWPWFPRPPLPSQQCNISCSSLITWLLCNWLLVAIKGNSSTLAAWPDKLAATILWKSSHIYFPQITNYK